MTVAILLQDKLERTPETRVSRNGNSFTTATIRASAGNELQFWRVFVFSESAQAELARLGEGDALTLQGVPKFELWRPENGEPRVSLSLTAEHVLALKQPPRERRPKAEKSVPSQDTRTRAERLAGDGVDYFNDSVPF